MEHLAPRKIDPKYFKLKENDMKTCSLPYTVPKVQKEMFKQEVEHLVVLGDLERANDSEWVAPYFENLNLNQINYIF